MMDSPPPKTSVFAPPAVAVVADDLTGSADTAIHFIPPGGSILLMGLDDHSFQGDFGGASGVALNTASRAAGEMDSTLAVQKAAGLIAPLSFRLIYKKVDSQMRGRPGGEIETLRERLGLGCAFIAPAYPEQDRLTKDGVHLVKNVPVAEGEAGQDPVTPVHESNLVRMISDQSRASAGLVTWKDLDSGLDQVGRKIESHLAKNIRLIVFDALRRSHLDIIAGIALERYPQALLAGSAGLAESAARCLGVERKPDGPGLSKVRRLLAVCGSQSRALHYQAKMLTASGKCREVVITPESLANSSSWDRLSQGAKRIWKNENLLIRLSGKNFPVEPAALLDSLSSLARTLILANKPQGLFLSGGDTALAVLQGSGVSRLRLRGEAIPGAAWGVAEQGDLDGVTLVTKAGAFGSRNLLLTLYHNWIEDLKNE